MTTHRFSIVHDAMALTGESPLWDETRQILWWLDIQGQRLLGYRESGLALAPIPLPSMPGLVAIADDGNLVLGLENGLYHFFPETYRFEQISNIEADRPMNRLNDGKPDADGRLWFGSMEKTGAGGAVGSFYCRRHDGSVTAVFSGVTVPNAIVTSPDGSTLYFADSPNREVLAFDLDRGTGQLSGRRIFATYKEGESPDGACIDSDGGLWVAVVGGSRIDRFHPDGSFDLSLATPVTRPTMAVFGGSDMRTLYVTSQRRFLDAASLAAQPAAGSLLATRVSHVGLTPFRVKI